MISSLHISGFKLFRDLELPKLGILNLFVGENNSGKTCLLEAVQLYASNSPWDIARIASLREFEGDALPRVDRYDNSELSGSLQSILRLFHRKRGKMRLRIRLNAGYPEAELRLACSPTLLDFLDDEGVSSEIDGLGFQSGRGPLRRLVEGGLLLSRGQEEPRPLFSDRSSSLRKEESEEVGWSHADSTPVAFLPARGITSLEEKRLWDRASLADRDEFLLDWLRFVEPEIRDLRYISATDSSGDQPYLKINSDRGRTPLSEMGDGLIRLFHIGLMMANASGGILLIDEFENGLHWRVQEELWRALFQAAQMFGVQVFATTHSTDCIRAFLEAQKDRLIPNESYVYRLERRGDNIHAHEFSQLGLEAAMRQGIEVR